MKRIYISYNYIVYVNDTTITPVSIKDSKYKQSDTGWTVYDPTNSSFFVEFTDITNFFNSESGSEYWSKSEFEIFLDEQTSKAENVTVDSLPLPPNAATESTLQKLVPNKTAYGELTVAVDEPFVQSNATYDFLPSNFRDYTSSGGSASVADRLFTVNTGTTLYGYGAIQSFRSLNYKSGQGAIAKFGALFESSVANSWTGVGLVNLSDELSFGYNGLDFGVWHRYGGVAAVRTLTITTPSSGSTNLTLTLNSVGYTIPLTSGTTAKNAYEVANWLNANQSIWVADQIDNKVIISAQSDGAKGGTYSYSHATSVGTIANTKTGVTKTSVHTPQSSWNVDLFESLDPTKLNLYKIVYDDNAHFYIADETTGYYTLVHTIHWLNNSIRSLLNNPSLRFGMYGASVGSTTNITVKCSFAYVGLQGKISKIRNPRAVKNTQNVSTTFTNVLTVRNRRTYNASYNQVEIEPLLLSVSTESTKNVEIEVRTNAVPSGVTNFTSAGNNLVSDVDTTANTITGGSLLAAFSLGSSGSITAKLNELDISIPPSLAITISARVTSGSSANVTAALTYYENI